MPRLHAHVLFRGPLVAVTDVSCRAPAAARCGPEERTGSHQLIFTRRGLFVKHDGAGARRRVVAEPVHVLLMNAGEPYRVSHPADGGDDCTSVSFAADAVLDAVGAIDPRVRDRPDAPFRVTHAPLAPDLLLRQHVLRRALHRAARAGAPDPLAVEEEALALLADVARAGYRAHGAAVAPAREGTLRARRDLVERTKEALAARPGARRTLAALAREVHSSPYHLTRVFRELVGVPVHRYLLRLRLAAALERLDAGERNLSALALDLGFSSHSHFTTRFRRLYGVAPSRLAALQPTRP